MPTFKPPAPPFISARYRGGKQTPKAIVMHGTVSSDNPGTARNIAKWWQGPTSPKSSCHYVVDPRETIQCVGDHTVAFHCGHNTGSIGVELCDEQAGPASRWSDKDSQAIIKRAARLVAELCLAYGISPSRPSIASLKRKGPHGIYGHNDSRLAFGKTSHTDPRDFPWKQFLKLVKIEVAAIKRGAKVKPPKPARASLSVATWNIENKNDGALDRGAVVKFLAAEEPDVFCGQEVYGVTLTGIPGYRYVYHATKGYPINSENRAQAILVRDGVTVKERNPIAMALSWVGPKMGIRKNPRVHRAVTVSKGGKTWRVSTWHVPFGAKPVEETRLALVSWLKRMGALGPAIAVGDLNALAKDLAGKVGRPSSARVAGEGLDRAIYRGCTKVAGYNLGDPHKRSDHDAWMWRFEA